MAYYTTEELDCFNRFISTGTILTTDDFNPVLFKEQGFSVYDNIPFTKMRLMELWHVNNEGIINGLEEVNHLNDPGMGIIGLLLEDYDYGYLVDTSEGYTNEFFVLDDQYKTKYNEWIKKGYIRELEPLDSNSVSFTLVNCSDEVYYNITTVRSPSEFYHIRRLQYKGKHIFYEGHYYKSNVLELMEDTDYFIETAKNILEFNNNIIEWKEPLCPLFYYDGNEDNSDPLEVLVLDTNTLEIRSSDQFRYSITPNPGYCITPEDIKDFMETDEFYENLIYCLGQYPSHRRAIINIDTHQC